MAAKVGNIAVAGFSVLAIAIAGWWVHDRLTHVNVVDARIAASMVTVSPRVAGWLSEVHVGDGDWVEAGDVVASIEDSQARYELAEAVAAVASLDAEVEGLEADVEVTEARVAAQVARAVSGVAAAGSALEVAKSEHKRAKSEWDRASPLLKREIISLEDWEEKQSRYERAAQTVRVESAEFSSAKAAHDEALVGQQSLRVLQAEVRRKRQERERAVARRDKLAEVVSDHRVKSPISGVVDETFVDAGEYVSRGQQLFVVHDPERIWVRANIKETDIRHLTVGAPARITVDAYPDREFEGTVSHIGNAATSQFRLLPNPNPSGNFTKITQRIEVHFAIEQVDGLLKPGMMVEVEVDR